MKERPSARILLFDQAGRLLLLQAIDGLLASARVEVERVDLRGV